MKSLRQLLHFQPLLSIVLFGLVLSVNTPTKTALAADPPLTSDTANDNRLRSAVEPSGRVWILFEPPTDEQMDASRGGASRPGTVKCIHDEVYPFPLTALVPRSGWGRTAAAHPTLLVYVPPTQAEHAHFTLRDAANNGVYQAVLPVAPSGGILSIDLPPDSPELSVGEVYQWSLALLCQSPQTDMPIASGQIQRIEMSAVASPTEQPLAEQPLWAQAITYGRAGVWHDMLASLVTLQQGQPDNSLLNANWHELLQSERLGAIADAPLLDEKSSLGSE